MLLGTIDGTNDALTTVGTSVLGICDEGIVVGRGRTGFFVGRTGFFVGRMGFFVGRVGFFEGRTGFFVGRGRTGFFVGRGFLVATVGAAVVANMVGATVTGAVGNELGNCEVGKCVLPKTVGRPVPVPDCVGALVGLGRVGFTVTSAVGVIVDTGVVGAREPGITVEGEIVGIFVGMGVCRTVGMMVGASVVGDGVGATVGVSVGRTVGDAVAAVGALDGWNVTSATFPLASKFWSWKL